MDYSFVPGLASGDGYLVTLNGALQIHPNMTVLSPAPDTLSDFLTSAKMVNVFVPSEDLVLGTHADDEGIILVGLDSTIPSPITYEKLQNATSIKLPSELNKPGTSFRILGCMIGSDRSLPLLKLLKQALGNPQAVVAPKYLYGVAGFGGGFLETMLYEFRILSKTALGSRDAVKQAFQDANNSNPPPLVDVNATKIPSDKWDIWIPSESKLVLNPSTKHLVPFTIKANVSISSGVSISMNVSAFWVAIRETITIAHVDTGEPSESKKTRTQLVQAGIPNDARFKQSHPFPYYLRYYYDSAQSFVDGVNWTFAAAEGGTMWKFVGERYLYELFVPITEPGTDDLLSNYYHSGQAPVVAMSSGHGVDARLFASV
jgi:hypothetical protein